MNIVLEQNIVTIECGSKIYIILKLNVKTEDMMNGMVKKSISEYTNMKIWNKKRKK